MNRIIAFLVALLTLGCSSYSPPLALRISPRFSGEHIETIESAAKEWFLLVPEARVPVLIEDSEEPGSIAPRPLEDDCDRLRGVTNLETATVELCENGGIAQFRVSALHELGHLLSGRDDHLEPGNVMAVAWDPDVENLTAEDVSYLSEAR